MKRSNCFFVFIGLSLLCSAVSAKWKFDPAPSASALNSKSVTDRAGSIHTSASVFDPSPPQNLRAEPGDGFVKLSWDPNPEPSLSHYNIYGGKASTPTTRMAQAFDLLNTSVEIQDLENGATYYFRVTAVDANFVESDFSDEARATPKAADPPPAAPQNLQAVAGNSSVSLIWDASTEVDVLRYRIYSVETGSTRVDSVEGRLNTSAIITGLVNQKTYTFYVTAVDQALQESGSSNLVNATPARETNLPSIGAAAINPPVPTLNTEISITVDASDDSGIERVTLWYRVGGAAQFTSSAMEFQGSNTFAQTIPDNFVTDRSVEFFIQADDVNGNSASTQLFPIRVRCPEGIANRNIQPSGNDASHYRIFSIPLGLDDPSPAAFLRANPQLGAPDKTKYRWYGFDRQNQALQEYPDFANLAMTPGMGFPLIVNIPNVRLNTSSGETITTTRPYDIQLPQGWSLIGNPFNFQIPYDSLTTSNGVAFELWAYGGDWRMVNDGLQSWTGYAVKLDQSATFSIRPGVSRLNKQVSFYSVENNRGDNWLIQITAENGRSASRFNFVGQHAAAQDGRDPLDLHRPMRLPGQVDVVLNPTAAGNPTDFLKADIRRPKADGHNWEFSCWVNPEDEVLQLEFDGVHSVPENFEVFLIDRDTDTAYDLRHHQRLQFAIHNLAVKNFKLVTGTKAHLNSLDLEAELYPSNFALLQNYPNPFNPTTQIVYTLRQASHVELNAYNIRGELVSTLVDEPQPSGTHSVVWQAQNFGSGVYFIRLQAGNVSRMKKCVLVK
jgi:hypothetical protein